MRSVFWRRPPSARWMSTLDYKVAFYDPAVDPVDPQYDGAEDLYLLARKHPDAALSCAATAIWRCCRAGIATPTSFRKRPGSWVSNSCRGSTFGGGSSAIRELLRRSRWMNLTITPDGPRGPAPPAGPGLGLSGVEARAAAGAVGHGLRPALADAQLGPLCPAPSLFAGPGGGRPVDHDSARSRSRRAGALSAADRESADAADRRGRSLGRMPARRRSAR